MDDTAIEQLRRDNAFLRAEISELRASQKLYMDAIQQTLGPIVRAIEGSTPSNGLLQRQSNIEAMIYALTTRMDDAELLQRKHALSFSSELDLKNQIAALQKRVDDISRADRLSLTRAKLGRLMLVHGLVSQEELDASFAGAEDVNNA